MSYYKCVHCNQTAISKCVNQRTIFPQDQFAAILTHVLKSKVEWPHEEQAKVTLQVSVPLTNCDTHNDPSDGAIEHALTMIRDLSDQQIHQYACTHHWKLDVGESNGECMFGCCKEEYEP